MRKIGIYHHVQGKANQYFVSTRTKVLFQIPNWLGRLLKGWF